MTELTADDVQRIIHDEKLTATANWFGPTGRPQSSAWIDRVGDEWVVWETDERAVRLDVDFRFRSEAEALDLFLRFARSHQAADSHAVRRIGGSS